MITMDFFCKSKIYEEYVMSSLVVIGYMNMVDIPCILKFFMQKDVQS